MSPIELPDEFAGLVSATASLSYTPTVEEGNPTPAEGHSYPSTTRYDMFRLLPENRPVNEQQVRLLLRQLRQQNLLHIRPIDVTSEFDVIDGQHRLAAARELGIPIYYRVVQGVTDTHMIILNAANKNWSNNDYLRFWCLKGNPDYLKLKDFLDRHTFMAPTVGRILMQKTTANTDTIFKRGEWKAAGAAEAEEIVGLLEVIERDTSFSQVHSIPFMKALYYCVVFIEGLKQERLMRVITQPNALVPCISWRDYRALLGELYNYNTPQELRLNFL
jgi:hypothetical protein